MENKINVSVGIVTYNSSKDILKCLETLYVFAPKRVILDVFVYDNQSPDSHVTRRLVSDKFPGVRLICAPDNRGFGHGHNAIIEKLESDFHLILNPDIEFSIDALSSLLDYLMKNADAALVSPEIRNIDGSIQHLPKLYPKLRFVLSSTVPAFARYRKSYTREDDTFTEPTEMEVSTGCFMLVRTSQLRSVDGFDDGYFLYFEDFDLSRKLSRLGKLIYYPSVYVKHFWHRDSKKSKKLFVIQINSMFRFYRKWGVRW